MHAQMLSQTRAPQLSSNADVVVKRQRSVDPACVIKDIAPKNVKLLVKES